MLPHQGGHARRTVDPKKVAGEDDDVADSKDDNGGDYVFDVKDPAHLLRYILAWKVPKKTFSNDDETPAPSHVSASNTHLEIKAKAKMNMKIKSSLSQCYVVDRPSQHHHHWRHSQGI